LVGLSQSVFKKGAHRIAFGKPLHSQIEEQEKALNALKESIVKITSDALAFR
jgi:hypothetical protein